MVATLLPIPVQRRCGKEKTSPERYYSPSTAMYSDKYVFMCRGKFIESTVKIFSLRFVLLGLIDIFFFL